MSKPSISPAGGGGTIVERYDVTKNVIKLFYIQLKPFALPIPMISWQLTIG